MQATLFDFELSPDRIAQRPLEKRDSSKLLVCQASGRLGEFRSAFSFKHGVFTEIESLLDSNDLVVTNDAKVLPIRLLGHRDPNGGAVEALLLRRLGEREWSALLHLSARVKPGMKFVFEPGLVAEVLSTHEERLASEGEVRLAFSGFSLERIALETWLERHGHVPLPPYIERTDSAQDKVTYQTVYATKTGSAAAPTAGFHFTSELLDTLRAKGVSFSSVTLHVGIGTFRPMKAETIDEHVMHEETYEISEEFVRTFRKAKAEGKRIVAIGTTVVRALESWFAQAGETEPVAGVFKTRAFIKPGFKFRAVDAMVTNFHLPRSTLLVLVAAAMGVEPMREAYRHAIGGEYRFFSYGDAMFIGDLKNA